MKPEKSKKINKITTSAVKSNKISQYFAIRAITGASLSPDSKKIAYITNTNGLPNIWTIPIEGGWANQVTIEDNAVFSLLYSPKGNRIVFTKDLNGDENHQIFIISDKGGEPVYLTPSHFGSQITLCSFNKKGDKLLFSSNKRDERFFDTYITDLNTNTEEMIYEYNEPYPFNAVAWSENEKYILFQKFYSNSNQDLIIYDTSLKTFTNFTQHTGGILNSYGSFDKKSNKVYFLSDYEREFNGLAYYNIKSGKFSWEQLENWDITNYSLSKDNKKILYSVNESGTTKLKLKNLKTGKIKSLKIPKGNCSYFEFTKNSEKVVLVLDSPQNPNDIYIYDLKKNKIKQITFSMIGGIPKNNFVIPENIKYNSFDGLEINGFMYLPKGIKKDGTNPAIVWPHGGPEWQEKNLFNKYFQILTNRGYIVIAPNFRGSTGYGKSFQKMIYRDWGGNEFKDVLGAYEYIVKSGYADKNKIAVAGGSFGGFMSLTCATRAPERWKCAVDIFGPSNLVTFCNSVPEHWKPGVAELVGDGVKDREFLLERSPISYITNITAPLLIIQGKNDPRVVQTESDQIAEKLKELNKDVEYYVLDDEGHGFSKVSNQIRVWNLICEFLDKHLK